MNTKILGRASKFNICVREMSLTAHAGIALLQDFVERIELPELIDQYWYQDAWSFALKQLAKLQI